MSGKARRMALAVRLPQNANSKRPPSVAFCWLHVDPLIDLPEIEYVNACMYLPERYHGPASSPANDDLGAEDAFEYRGADCGEEAVS